MNLNEKFINMMSHKIIYPNDDGTICVISPMNPNLSLVELAEKDVPEGKPYKIIKAEDLPEDRTFRNAWTFDFSKPDGHGKNNEEWHFERTPPEPAPVFEEPVDE